MSRPRFLAKLTSFCNTLEPEGKLRFLELPHLLRLSRGASNYWQEVAMASGCLTAGFVLTSTFLSYRSNGSDNRYQLVSKRPAIRYRSRRSYAAVPRCASNPPNEESEIPDGGSGLDGELRDALDTAIRDVMRSTSVEEMRAGEERVFDGIVELGEGDLKEIGQAVSDELNDAGDNIADRIDTLLEGELDKTLSHFETKRDELMREALNQREVIRDEAARINSLASSLDRSSATSKEDMAARGKQNALFAVSGLFGIAALTYGWRGLVDESNAAMQSAALDAVAAGAAAYVYQIGERKSDDVHPR